MKHTFILVVTLLLAGAVLQATVPAQAQTGGPGLGYVVQASTTTGGDYQVTSFSWHVSGSAAGGAYDLAILPADGPWGQCCCMFLPLTLRNYK